MDSTPPDPGKIQCESGQRYYLPCIYDNSVFLASCNILQIPCMAGTTHTSSQPSQAKFDTGGVSIGVDNRCSITMSIFNQDFVEPLKKGRRIINVFEGPKVYTIYEVIIDSTVVMIPFIFIG